MTWDFNNQNDCARLISYFSDSTGSAFLMLDHDLRIIHASGSLDWILGTRSSLDNIELSSFLVSRDNELPISIKPLPGSSKGPVYCFTDNKSGRKAVVLYYVISENDDDSPYAIALITPDLREKINFTESLITKLSVAVEEIPASVLIADSEGIIEYVNRGFVQMTGYSAGQVIGNNFFDELKRFTDSELYGIIQERLSQGKLWAGELELQRITGTTYWESIRIISLKNSEGKIINYVKIGEDTTDRRGLIDSLIGSYEFIEKIMNNIMPVFVYDSLGEIIMANKGFLNLTGKKMSECLGESIDAFFPARDLPMLRESISLALRTEETIKGIESEIVCESLRKCIVSISFAPVGLEDSGKSVVCTLEDITARKKAETELKKLYQAVEQSPASVIITDTEGTIEYVNPKFTTLTGYSMEEVLGKNPRILKSGEHSRSFYTNMWVQITSGNDWRGEFHNKKKNGELYWEFASISPLRNNRGETTHFIAVKEDITERKKAEEALRVSEENLRIKNEAMRRDLNYAQIIIKRLLPDTFPSVPYLKGSVCHCPLEAVGGDFYSFYPQDKGILGVMVGDVSGHGVSAALFLSLLKFSSDRISREHSNNPANFINSLNEELCKSMASYFVTAIYGVFRPADSCVIFSFAKGGHPPPFVLRGDTGKVEIINVSGKPLGLFEDIEYKDIEITLKKGDRIFLISDGIPETVNPSGHILDYSGLSRILEEASEKELDKMIEYVMKSVDDYRNGGAVEDDIILLGFEITDA